MKIALTKEVLKQLWRKQQQNVIEIMTGLAHELKQPLTGISVYAENILCCIEEELPLEQEEIAEGMRNIVEQVEIIQKSLEQHCAEDDFEEFDHIMDMVEVTKSVIRLIKRQLSSRTIFFEFQHPDHPCWVEGDAEIMRFILFDLLCHARNAAQKKTDYSIEETPRVSLRLSVEEFDFNPVNYIVTIEDAVGDYCFEYDAKGTKPFTSESGDLGFSMAELEMKEYGGTLEMKPSITGGAVVIIRLPAAREIM